MRKLVFVIAVLLVSIASVVGQFPDRQTEVLRTKKMPVDLQIGETFPAYESNLGLTIYTTDLWVRNESEWTICNTEIFSYYYDQNGKTIETSSLGAFEILLPFETKIISNLDTNFNLKDYRSIWIVEKIVTSHGSFTLDASELNRSIQLYAHGGSLRLPKSNFRSDEVCSVDSPP